MAEEHAAKDEPTNAGDGSGGNAGGEGDNSKSDNKNGNGEGGAGDDKSKDDPANKGGEGDGGNADDEPPTRKRNSFFVQRRQQAKAEKDKSKKEGGEGAGEGDGSGEGDDDDGEIDPRDLAIIDKYIGKRLKPFTEQQEIAETNREISDFLTGNPDFKPYETKIRKYALHDGWKNVPIAAIANHIAAPDLMRIGVERHKAAEEKAKGSQTGGGNGNAGGGEGKKDYKGMTKEQHQAEMTKMMSGQS